MAEQEKQLVADGYMCLHDFSGLAGVSAGRRFCLSLTVDPGKATRKSGSVYLSKAEALKLSDALGLKMSK